MRNIDSQALDMLSWTEYILYSIEIACYIAVLVKTCMTSKMKYIESMCMMIIVSKVLGIVGVWAFK